MNWRSLDRNLKVRILGEGMIQIFFWMFFPFQAMYFTNLYGAETAGWLLTVPPLMGLLLNLVGGRIADRRGRRPAMIGGIWLQSGFFLLYLLAPSPHLEFLAYIGVSMSYSLYLPASGAMVADLTTDVERRYVFSLLQTVFNIGLVAGPVLGAFLFETHRSLVLGACALALFAYGLILFLFLRETLPEPAKGTVPGEGAFAGLRGYGAILRDKVFALYLLGGVLIAVVYMQTSLYLAVYVEAAAGMDAYGWMMGLNGLLVTVFTVRVNRLFAKLSDRLALVLSSLLQGSSLFLMAFSSNLWFLLGCMALFAVGEMMRAPAAQGFIARHAPERMRGQYMAASSLQFSFGRFFAPLVIGLGAWLPPLGVLAVLLLLAACSALSYALLFRSLS